LQNGGLRPACMAPESETKDLTGIWEEESTQDPRLFEIRERRRPLRTKHP